MSVKYNWHCTFCEYLNEATGGKVKVSTLHWTCTSEDTDHPDITVQNIGSVGLQDQNRVYALPALKNVPEHVMVGWLKTALGDDMVAEIEKSVQTQHDEQVTPSGGGFVPEEPTDPLPPLDDSLVTGGGT